MLIFELTQKGFPDESATAVASTLQLPANVITFFPFFLGKIVPPQLCFGLEGGIPWQRTVAVMIVAAKVRSMTMWQPLLLLPWPCWSCSSWMVQDQPSQRHQSCWQLGPRVLGVGLSLLC
jgi:hypothetical protein